MISTEVATGQLMTSTVEFGTQEVYPLASLVQQRKVSAARLTRWIDVSSWMTGDRQEVFGDVLGVESLLLLQLVLLSGHLA